MTRIQQIVKELYSSGKITFGEACAIIHSMNNCEISDKDVLEVGTITKEGLQSLKGVV